VNLAGLSDERKNYDVKSDSLGEGEIIWKERPNGVVFKRIGYIAPFNQDGSWLLNMDYHESKTVAIVR
jgi:hypothetical protein